KRGLSKASLQSIMKLTAAQLAQKRKRNQESQRKLRQKTKDQIDTLQRQVQYL
ncbi:hypothetical protein EJ02DRAFT_310626, partial [Clathrospora elynae]